MKKLTAIVLAFLMVLSVFSACGKEESKKPVTITVLVESSSSISNGFNETLRETLKLEKGISLEFVTVDSGPNTNRQSREQELQYIRAQVMAGKGPDIYVLPTSLASRHEAVFIDLNETIENGLFLTLDEYIADSEVINIEDYIPSVLDAGKTKEGQQVIPLLYTVPAMFTDRENADALMTVNEVFQTGDANLLSDINRILSDSETGIWLFPQVADYSKFELAITEEDILSTFDKISSIGSSGAYIESQIFDENLLYDCRDKSLVLLKNNEGGITAKATAFAAIDRNCEHPEEAFEVLEMICGYASHGQKSLRPDPSLYGASEGLATLAGYLKETDLVDTEMLSFIENNVTIVSFNSNLDEVLYRSLIGYNPKDPSFDKEKYISDLYTELKMHLAE